MGEDTDVEAERRRFEEDLARIRDFAERLESPGTARPANLDSPSPQT